MPNNLTLRNYSKWIKKIIDPYDWGLHKKHIHTKDELTDWVHLGRRKAVKTSTHLKDHLALDTNHPTYIYYTNKPSAPIGLWTIDIDAYPDTSDNDRKQVIDALSLFHPDSYWEYSSSGKGIHYYFLLAAEKVPRKQINKLLSYQYNDPTHAPYGLLLRLYINSLNIRVKIDNIKGNYPLNSYRTMGTLCKLPRPTTDEQFEQVINMPVNSIESIYSRINYIKSHLDAYSVSYPSPDFSFLNDLSVCEDFSCQKNTSLTDVNISLTYSLSYNSNNMFPPKGNLHTLNDKIESKKNAIRNDPDAIKRCFNSSVLYYHIYRHYPDFDQWNKFYEDSHFNTDTDNGKRRTRFDEAIVLIKADYDPQYETLYAFGEYIPSLKALISMEDILSIRAHNKCYKTISYVDLDVAAGGLYWFLNSGYFNGKPIPDYQKERVAGSTLQKWFKKIAQYHKVNLLHNDKIKPIREILEKIRYYTVVDRDYSFTGEEKYAMKYAVDVKHPKYNT